MSVFAPFSHAAVFDASARDQLGVASGILYQLGHYDQCLHQEQPSEESRRPGGSNSSSDIEKWPKVSPVLAQYCLIEVSVDGLGHAQKIVSRRRSEVNSLI